MTDIWRGSMPVYKYHCQNCSVEFEIPQTYFEKTLTLCPVCLKGTVRRIPQLPAVIFKGSGWYSTDHLSDHQQKANILKEKSDESARSSHEKREKIIDG
jgi:putative FmdB family regulatory protein